MDIALGKPAADKPGPRYSAHGALSELDNLIDAWRARAGRAAEANRSAVGMAKLMIKPSTMQSGKARIEGRASHDSPLEAGIRSMPRQILSASPGLPGRRGRR